MIREISSDEYFKDFEKIPLIDVRSPSEYLKGHIHGAHSVPLFSDDERAHIGTVYVQKSEEEAFRLGYHYALPKSDHYISESFKTAPEGKATVHCWRGGLRSRMFAELLHSEGFSEVYIIKGGYKALRNYVLETFSRNSVFHILGGYTGSGKTEILKIFKEEGLQVIDLEALANHKGSAFGGIGKDKQPTYEQFENDLFYEWQKLNPAKPIWLEDESIKIGAVQIPNAFYNKMVEAPLFFLDIPKEIRARNLTDEYASCENSALADSLKKISKRLGDQNTRIALKFLEEQNYYDVALTALSYYDKAYREVISARNPKRVFTISATNTDPVANAKLIIELCKNKYHE